MVAQAVFDFVCAIDHWGENKNCIKVQHHALPTSMWVSKTAQQHLKSYSQHHYNRHQSRQRSTTLKIYFLTHTQRATMTANIVKCDKCSISASEQYQHEIDTICMYVWTPLYHSRLVGVVPNNHVQGHGGSRVLGCLSRMIMLTT
jgi:hypothetical protein